MDIKEKALKIQNLINLSQFSQATIDCEKLIKKFPHNSYFYNLKGLILQKSGQLKKSIEFFEKAMSLEKKNYAAMNNLATVYKNLYEFKKSEELYKKVLKEDPTNVKVLNNYSNFKKEFNQYNDSKKLLLQAIKLEPGNVGILLNLAICSQGLGEMNEAKNYAFKILDIQPLNTSAHKLLSSIINYKKEPDHFEKMKQLLNDEKHKNFSLSEKTDLFFAVGKAYEDIKDFKNAYKYLSKANTIEKQNNNFDLGNTKKLFHNLTKLFDNLELKNLPKYQNKKQHIFICGMPRSGTTLIEQILASHSKVRGAGEIHYLSHIISDNFIANNHFNKSKIIEESSKLNNTVLEKYNDLLNFHQFDTDIVTDKAPQNFIWIGFIKLFFPNSKIIHCCRNPKDNCLSIFKNYFSSRTMFWAYDQNDITEYYILYSKMMNYWKSKFKDTIFDANYENIVNSPESEVRKLISFCDLKWEPDCLNFYQNKKTPVQTVSVSQASKPIYKSSVNSNLGYSEHLSKMFNILDSYL